MAGDAVQKRLDTSGGLPSLQLRLHIERIIPLRMVAVFTNIVWGG
jgi:hypothetical protein